MLKKSLLLLLLSVIISCTSCKKKNTDFAKILHHEELKQVELKPFKDFHYQLRNENIGSALDEFSKELGLIITADKNFRNQNLKVEKDGTLTFFEFISGIGNPFNAGTFFHLNPFLIDFQASRICKTYATKDFLIKCHVGNTGKKDKPIGASVQIFSDIRSLIVKKATCRMYQGDYYMEFWAYDWFNKSKYLYVSHNFSDFDIKKEFEYEVDIEAEKQKAFVLFIDLKEYTEFNNENFTITTNNFKVEKEPMVDRNSKCFDVKLTLKDSYLNSLLSTHEQQIYHNMFSTPVRVETANKEQKMIGAVMPKLKGVYLARNNQIFESTNGLSVNPISSKETLINAYFLPEKIKDSGLQLAFVFTMAKEKDPQKNKFKETVYFKL